jgi:membrane-anchored glycerophosphoryl diester phosphodiesterase (GDPDase)
MMRQMMTAYAGSIPIFLICLVPLFYFYVGFLFALPLIIDKEMDFWTAIKTSWRMVHRHWFTVFGLFFVVSLINAAGFFLCCIPVFFTFAFTTAACMFAYETIFGESRRG